MNVTTKKYCFLLYIVITSLMLSSCLNKQLDDVDHTINVIPEIFPDYSGVFFPPNIAPINFKILEEGDRYKVIIKSSEGNPIIITSKSNKIEITFNEWKEMLARNRNEAFSIRVIVCREGKTLAYKPIVNHIAPYPVDPYLVYRLLQPQYHYWSNLGIYQRNLTSYKEEPVLTNATTEKGCMNCHNFCMNKADHFVMHTRGGPGTVLLLKRGDQLEAVNTVTKFNKAPGAYPAWHPSGNMVVFSTNKLALMVHSNRVESREVIDYSSNLIMYRIDSNYIETSPLIASRAYMENWPHWSPDGKNLYFSAAPKVEQYVDSVEQNEEAFYNDILYSIVRVGYDAAKQEFYGLDTVINAEHHNKSYTIPRVSPDNRYLLVTEADWGNFPVYNKSADLFLYDLVNNQEIDASEVNSHDIESYHSWSSNAHWFVFSSKRVNGLYAMPYFAYIDSAGNIKKPFLLPQKDPDYYKNCLNTFNVPELIKNKIDVSIWELSKKANDVRHFKNARFKPSENVDQTSGETITEDAKNSMYMNKNIDKDQAPE